MCPCLTLLRLAELDAELNTLKTMVGNMIAFLYPSESSTGSRAPQMLDSLMTRFPEIILTNIKQSVSLTLRILNPQAGLDEVGEGFAATCSDEESFKLIEDSAVIAGHIVDMLPLDMSLG
jgi:hypothetical protein